MSYMYPPSSKTLEDAFTILDEMKAHIEQSTMGFSLFTALETSSTAKNNVSAWSEVYRAIRYLLVEVSMFDFSVAHPTVKEHLAVLRKTRTLLKKVKPHDSGATSI